MAGRTTIDLQLYKAQIISWFEDENKTLEEIADLIKSSYDVQVTTKTVQRRLKSWGISKRPWVRVTAELRARIAYFFCGLGFTDDEIVHAFECEGVQISKRCLVRIRCELGLWRR